MIPHRQSRVASTLDARHRARAHRFRLISVLASVLVLGGTTIASAHTKIKSTSPASGMTVQRSIARVTVTFTSPLERGTLRVVGPGGKIVSLSNGGRDPRNPSRLLVGLNGSLKAGSYKASWTILAKDGHTQKGSFRFKLRQ